MERKQETTEELLETYDLKWDQSIEKNKNTVVIPVGFVEIEDYVSYTRLSLSKNKDGVIEPYFYTVVPANQEPRIFKEEEIKSFNGSVFTVDILTGNWELTEFVRGVPLKSYEAERAIQPRCCIPWNSSTLGSRFRNLLLDYTSIDWGAEPIDIWGESGNENSGYNPIDVEGLSGMQEEMFENLVSQFALFNEFSFEQLVHTININCLDADNFDECAQQSLDARRRLAVRMWFLSLDVEFSEDVNFLDYINCVTFDETGTESVNEDCIISEYTHSDELSNLISFIADYELEGLVDLSGLIGSCEDCANQRDFNEHAVIALTDNLEDCANYDFIWCNDLENSPTGICPETFKVTSVGTTYSCDVSAISFKYAGLVNRTMYIGDLCISIPKRDNLEQNITESQAADLLAQVWTEAQWITEVEFVATNHTMPQPTYRGLFVTNFGLRMGAYFSGSVSIGSMSVSNSACPGTLPVGKPVYSIFCQ